MQLLQVFMDSGHANTSVDVSWHAWNIFIRLLKFSCSFVFLVYNKTYTEGLGIRS